MSKWGQPYQPTANMDRRMFDIETKELVQELKKAGFSTHSQLSRVSGVTWEAAKRIYCNKQVRLSGKSLQAIKGALETGNPHTPVVLSFNAALQIVEGNLVN